VIKKKEDKVAEIVKEMETKKKLLLDSIKSKYEERKVEQKD